MQTLKSEAPIAVGLREARDILFDNPRFLKRKVRCAAHGNELEDPCVQALYTLACGHRFQWTPADWKVIADRLDSCELSVGEWLNGLASRA